MDGDGDSDAVDVGRHFSQIDFDLLVVTVAISGTVVSRVLHGTVAALQVVVKNEFPRCPSLCRLRGGETPSIQVERIPAAVFVDSPV